MQMDSGGFLVGLLAFGAVLSACGHDAFEPGRACAAGATRTCYSPQDKATEGVGACHGGTQTCRADETGWGACEGEVTPQAETCLSPEPADEDCDGEVNEDGEGCACLPGAMEACYTGPDGTEGIGVCAAGARACAMSAAWGACTGDVVPEAEDCDNPDDDDCDGVVCAGPLWAELFGNADAQSVGAIASDAEGNAIVAGGFNGAMKVGDQLLTSNGASDVFVAKLDGQGKKLWAMAFGGTAAESATSAAVTLEGDVVVAGSFASSGVVVGAFPLGAATAIDAFVVKLDGATGAPKWAVKINGDGNGGAASIATDPTGNTYVGGSFSGTLCTSVGLPCVASIGGSIDGWVAKITPMGVIVWARTFGGTAFDAVNAIATDGAGNLVAVGVAAYDAKWAGVNLFTGDPFDLDFIVAKLKPNGDLVWAGNYGNPAVQEASGVATTAAGDIVVTGHAADFVTFGATQFGDSSNPAFVAKLSAAGAPLWGKAFGKQQGASAGESIAVDAAGNLAIAGTAYGAIDFGAGEVTPAGTSDAFLVKLDAQGGYLWSKLLGAAGVANAGRSVAFTPSGNVLFAAHVNGTIDFGLGGLTAAGKTDVGAAAFAP